MQGPLHEVSSRLPPMSNPFVVEPSSEEELEIFHKYDRNNSGGLEVCWLDYSSPPMFDVLPTDQVPHIPH